MLLGWIGFLPMMQFSLARNIFMHYHALHVYFFLLSYALPLAVILCLSSLSLLISLLVMEPKKSVPSENLIHRGSSSSFPFDSIWFCDEKARDDFFENFSNRVIHLER